MTPWEKGIREQEEIFRANPTRPFNLHFYEAKLEGRLRIFDLFLDPRGITIGETLVGDMQPLKDGIGVESLLYTHLNYGGMASQSTDDVMARVADECNLTDVVKFHEIQSIDQMKEIMPQVVQRLHKEYMPSSA